MVGTKPIVVAGDAQNLKRPETGVGPQKHRQPLRDSAPHPHRNDGSSGVPSDAMKIPVFVSLPRPFTPDQETFARLLRDFLSEQGMEPRTLGVTDYDTAEPLTSVRRLMLESNGVITVAFRRVLIRNGTERPDTDAANHIVDAWMTSPWCHIEVAMAFQIGLPVLIFRERGVIADGVLEPGVSGTYLPEFNFDSDTPSDFFESDQAKQLIGKWEGQVRRVVEVKGRPTVLYD